MKIKISTFCLFFSVFSFSQIGFVENEITDSSRELLPNNKIIDDIDGDGDNDIVIWGYDGIDWYENLLPVEDFSRKKRIVLDANYSIRSIDISDLDGDDDLDIVFTSLNKIYWIENLDGLGNFGQSQILKSLQGVNYVKHVDMDNDLDKDLVVKDDSGLYYYINDGNNNYTNSVLISSVNNQITGTNIEFRVSDFNSDNYNDIFVKTGDGFHLFINNNNNTFNYTDIIENNISGVYNYEINDIDGDGDIDIICFIRENINTRKMMYLLNDGNGNFGSEQFLLQGFENITSLTLKDLDNDGIIDLSFGFTVNSNDELYDLVWYKGNNNYTFVDTNIIKNNVAVPIRFSFSDFDNNNTQDILIMTEYLGTSLSIHNNDGNGIFTFSQFISAGSALSTSAFAGDVDNDGDLDVVSTSYEDNKIALHKKLNEGYSDQILISGDVDGAKEVFLADVDGDTDLDIIAISGLTTSGSHDKLSWYENDGNGNFGSQNLIPMDIYGSPDGLRVYDVDNDGDNDIVTSLGIGGIYDSLVWFPNNGNGTFSNYITVGGGFLGINTIVEADADNDGFLDLFVSAKQNNKISWFKNTDGNGNFGAEQIITTNATKILDFYISDINSDNNLDVIYMSNDYDNKLYLQTNDGLGNFGTQQIIANLQLSASGSRTICAADLDNDTDIDIVVGEKNEISWYENEYGLGVFKPKKTITTNCLNPSSTSLFDLDNDGDLDIVASIYDSGKVVIFENIGQAKNTIEGYVRYDSQGNGCDTNDILFPNCLISTTDGTNTLATFTHQNPYLGFYQIFTDEGNYQTKLETELPYYYSVSPLVQNSDFVGYGNTDNVDFCIDTSAIINDLEISIYPLNEPRPGFGHTYSINYKNFGSTTLNGQIVISFDNSKVSFSSSDESPINQTSNSLTFEFNNIQPFENRQFYLAFNLQNIPVVQIGDALQISAQIDSFNTDNTPGNNIYILTESVVASYDPNDIRCIEGEQIDINNTDEFLHYIIRFQNTGNASAYNIKIEQDIDSKLDWKTIEIENTSHDSYITIENGNKLNFYFNNINLPDSNNNESESHGYVLYKIKPKNSIIVGDIITSTADIFFDNNPPITTNSYTTEIVSSLNNEYFYNNNFKIYPNPTKDYLNIDSDEEIDIVQIYSAIGKKVMEIENTKHIDISTLASGIYFVKIKASVTQETFKIIKM